MDTTPPPTVAHAFLRSIRAFEDRTAIIPQDGEPITYGDMAAAVRRAVALLRQLGIGPGDRIAIWLPNCPQWVYLQFAAALLGVCIIPVNARYRAPEVERVLKITRAVCLFTQGRFLTNDYLDRLSDIAGGDIGRGEFANIARLPDLRRVVLVDGTPAPGTVSFHRDVDEDVDIESLVADRRPDEPLWMFWTSGSTSAPKGAIMVQDAVRNIWNWTTMAGYRADDRVLMSRPLFYIAGNFWSMLGPLLHGAATVVGQLFTPDELVTLCRRYDVTVLSGNPLLLKGLVQDPAFNARAFEHVRLGYFGGTSVSYQDFLEIREKIGFTHLLQAYGMTELEGFATSTHPDDPADIVYATCGRPLPGLQMRLVDPVTEEDVPVGKTGVLLTRGRGFTGYEGLSKADEATLFTPDGWFRTGDLLRLREDGRYEFAGRAKDLIKVGGENVTAGEIENVLATHPSVLRVAVVPKADERRGEVPVAFAELRPGLDLSLPELQAWCARRLAPYKVPAELHLVDAGRWPMTASGKIAKHELV